MSHDFAFSIFKIQKNTEINYSLSAGRINPSLVVHTAPFGACWEKKMQLFEQIRVQDPDQFNFN